MDTHSVSPAHACLLPLDPGKMYLICGYQRAAADLARDNSYYSNWSHFIDSNSNGVGNSNSLDYRLLKKTNALLGSLESSVRAGLVLRWQLTDSICPFHSFPFLRVPFYRADPDFTDHFILMPTLNAPSIVLTALLTPVGKGHIKLGCATLNITARKAPSPAASHPPTRLLFYLLGGKIIKGA